MRVVAASSLYHFVPGATELFHKSYPDAKIWDKKEALEGDDLIEFCKGYDAACITQERFDDYVLSNLPELKILGMCTAGVDHMFPADCKKHGVKVGWIGGVNKIAVAEMTISQMVNIVRDLYHLSEQTHNGRWPFRRGGIRLHGKTIGIHGCGNIGKEVAIRLAGFGVKIIANDREDRSDFYAEHGIESVSPEELWARSDILTNHLPLNETTRDLYTGEVLDQMKPGSYLINIARGNMVDEEALAELLKSGHLAGATLDVYAVEPAIDHPLFELENFIGTPHCGSATIEDFLAMAEAGINAIDIATIPEPGMYPFD
jgi:D-3-phosphoglycerate dehydrogenase